MIKHIIGQRPNTRARMTQDAVDTSVRYVADAYRCHRIAYKALVGPNIEKGGWEDTMHELLDTDCRGL